MNKQICKRGRACFVKNNSGVYSNSIYFFFWSECLRWGPTSLQTVKRNVSGVYTVCTMLGAEDQNKKYILLLINREISIFTKQACPLLQKLVRIPFVNILYDFVCIIIIYIYKNAKI